MSLSTVLTLTSLTQQEQDDLRDDLRDVFRLMYDQGEGSDADWDADTFDHLQEVRNAKS
jgi:RNAse (barnase) inhibitor barstar